MKRKLIFYVFCIPLRFMGLCMNNPEKIYFPLEIYNDEDYMDRFNSFNTSISLNCNLQTEGVFKMLDFVDKKHEFMYFSIIRCVFIRNRIDCNSKNVFLLSLILRIYYLQNFIDIDGNLRDDLEFYDTQGNLILDFEKFLEIEVCFLEYKFFLENYNFEINIVEDLYFVNINSKKAVLWLFLKSNQLILKNEVVSGILKKNLFDAIHDSIFYLLIAIEENERINMLKKQNFDQIFSEYKIDSIVKNKINGNNILELLRNWLYDEQRGMSCGIFGTSISVNSVFFTFFGADILLPNEERLTFGILNEAYNIQESYNVDFLDTLKILLIKIYDEILKIEILHSTAKTSVTEATEFNNNEAAVENRYLKRIENSEFLEFERIFLKANIILSDLIKKQEFMVLIEQIDTLPKEIINSYMIIKSFLCNSYQIYENCRKELQYSHSLKYLDVLLEYGKIMMETKNHDLVFRTHNRFLTCIKLLKNLYNLNGSMDCINNEQISLLIFFFQVVNINDIQSIHEIKNLFLEISRQKFLKKDSDVNYAMKLRYYEFIEKVLWKFLELQEIYTLQSIPSTSFGHNYVENNFSDLTESSSDTTIQSLLSNRKCSTPLQNIDKDYESEFSGCTNLNQTMGNVKKNEDIQHRAYYNESGYVSNSGSCSEGHKNDSFLNISEYSGFAPHFNPLFDNILSNNSDIESRTKLKEPVEKNRKTEEKSSTEYCVIRNSNSESDSLSNIVYNSKIILIKNKFSDRLEEERKILFSLEFKSVPTTLLLRNNPVSDINRNTVGEENNNLMHSEATIEEENMDILKISLKCKEYKVYETKYLFEYEISVSTKKNSDKDFNDDSNEDKEDDTSTIRSNNQDSAATNFVDENNYKIKIMAELNIIEKGIDEYVKESTFLKIYNFMRYMRNIFSDVECFSEDSVWFIRATSQFNIQNIILDINNELEILDISEKNILFVKNCKEFLLKKICLKYKFDYARVDRTNMDFFNSTNEGENFVLSNSEIAAMLSVLSGASNETSNDILIPIFFRLIQNSDSQTRLEQHVPLNKSNPIDSKSSLDFDPFGSSISYSYEPEQTSVDIV
ncbi:hypothetical protein CWI39_1683p0010, partial [Hamiltosporidium magnivora]